ncbi:phloem protein 2 A5 [Arabidopsis thaliana]|uniref:Protein PHLOEM PROTEIN 2-LIKE A5 n=1 Tax=Arabidopsis thaliana TaxID=3702 RepID=P2A05_ARATH|nr:phloem protein 2 A5 [Arabidopsis thaliana]Q9C5Q9.1 RecName: Full=Protein PHLOEM PROTEIN 2-LIKE A5; Short=AtPP2-A5 [Arabidopsis thaliana]AAK17178.1 hypothetical protein [Arabidopsis thaliana]AEE34368.1 phloem protein 2 A5 [Arabidopsis thaliana]BAD44344.1 At1g65390 [Arabidopsis thaliana]|eukprot:NP_176718.2 phloem protein 2 A5 [Arabidopsis thaliana]
MSGASSVSSICSSNVSLIPTGPQVFINFRGKDLRKGFMSFLKPALKKEKINVFIDEQEERGKYLISLFDTIGESKIALVIFSEGYCESHWCMDELVKIKEYMDQNRLIIIPIFYRLDLDVVKDLTGKFGDNFWDLVDKYQPEPKKLHKWTEALFSVCELFSLILPKHSDISDRDFVKSIVKAVKKVQKNFFQRRNGEIEYQDFSVPACKLTITMHESPNEEAVQVTVLNEFYQMKNQSPVPSYEFKFWVDLTRPKGNVFMIDARDLSIAWSEDSNHWTWLPLPNQNSNESVMEIAFLKSASWLDVAGKFDTRYLTPRTRYEVVFVVKLEYTFEWETLVKLKLDLPNTWEKPQEQSVDMFDYISDQWLDIPVGEFTTSKKNVGEISFAMYEHECQLWKSGLFVKGVTIRPKY